VVGAERFRVGLQEAMRRELAEAGVLETVDAQVALLCAEQLAAVAVTGKTTEAIAAVRHIVQAHRKALAGRAR
jgi:hypothetical protein